MLILSIDLGSVNFSFMIEEIDASIYENIKTIPKSKRYNSDGTTTPEFEKILEDVYKNGKVILMKNINLKSGIENKKDHEIFQNMIECLDEYKEDYFNTVDIIIVEKQLKINQKACRLSICCISYFMNNYGREKPIIEFNAYHKTQVLGAIKNKKILKNGNIRYTAVDKPTRKKWSIDQCFYILTLREEFETIIELSNFKKLDDYADNLCMIQAFKYLYFIEKMEL
jgi:hypothetical protein